MNIRLLVAVFAAGLCFHPAALLAQPGDPPPAVATSASELGNTPIDLTAPAIPSAAFDVKIQANRPLTIQDTINLALGQSPQLKIARLAVDRAVAVLRQAQAGLFPTVSLSATYNYNQSAQAKVSNALIAQTTPSAAAGNTTTGDFVTTFSPVESAPVNGTATFNWTVFSSGLVGSRVLAANESLTSARLDYERQRQDLINNVISAYYDLQTADGNVEIGEAAVRSAEASRRDAQAQERAGVGTRFAVLQADVQLANAQQQLLQAQNQRIVNQRNLARQLNFPVPTAITAADTVERSGEWKVSPEETILQAYRGRVELNQQLAIERAAKAQEAVAYAQVSPQLSIFWQGQAYDNLLDQVVGIYTGYSAGAQLSWTAFDGGSARAQADQAISDAKTARFRYLDILNSVRFSVENSLALLETSNLRIQTSSAALSSAEEALRLARLRFQAGVGTQLEVINADRDLTQARVNRLIAIIDYNRALAAIRRATGTL